MCVFHSYYNVSVHNGVCVCIIHFFKKHIFLLKECLIIKLKKPTADTVDTAPPAWGRALTIVRPAYAWPVIGIWVRYLISSSPEVCRPRTITPVFHQEPSFFKHLS